MERRWTEPLEWLTSRGRWNGVAPSDIHSFAEAIAKDLAQALVSYPNGDLVTIKQADEITKVIAGAGKLALDHFDRLRLPTWGRGRFLQWTHLALLKRNFPTPIAQRVYNVLDIIIHRKVDLIDQIRTS